MMNEMRQLVLKLNESAVSFSHNGAGKLCLEYDCIQDKINVILYSHMTDYFSADIHFSKIIKIEQNSYFVNLRL
jgi:hypothetical protein